MKKIIKITESQLENLTKNRVNEVSAVELIDVLKNIPCNGESIKSLIYGKLVTYGFKDVNIKFLDYGENKKILKYVVYTEGPVFVIETMSNSKVEPPCMEVLNVFAYTKI